MKKFLLIVTGLVFAFVMYVFYIFAAGVTVKVKNVGKLPIAEVHVLVTGNQYDLGTIEAGAAKSVSVEATQDSSAAVSYIGPKAEKVQVEADTYFEATGPYHGSVVFQLDREKREAVKIESNVRLFP